MTTRIVTVGMIAPIAAALLLGAIGMTAAAIPVDPATPEVAAAAREALRVAFSSPDALRRAALVDGAMAIGPRLWAATVTARKPYSKETKDTFSIVSSPEMVTKWKLAPLDLATVADPTLHASLVEASKAGTPVVAGAIMKRGDVILPALVLAVLKAGDFPLTVRTPTESELEYYYSLIPYDLSDPILVIEGGGHAFLCDFENGAKLFFFEML